MKAIAACLCGLLVAAGGAQAANTSLLNPQQRADAWAAALRGIDGQLRRAEFGPARESAVDWVHDMVRYMGAGGQSAYTLAVVCAFRAIAASGLGDESEALWYWRTAEALFPGIDKTDLRPYGAPAARLKAIPFRSQPDAPVRQDQDVERPVLRKRVEPDYPQNMAEMGVAQPYVFEVVIDDQGLLREPRVLTPVQHPSFVYVVLDALRGWKFEPAKLHGKPVAVTYTLTVDFKLRR